MIIDIEFTERYPTACVLMLTVPSIKRVERQNDDLELEKRRVEKEIRKNYAQLDHDRIQAYQKFYKSLGIPDSHMKSQIKSIVRGKQMPVINTLVDSVFLPELANCILMGAHDMSKITGNITLTISKGDRYVGIGNRELSVPAGDIILKDDYGVIASVTMGPCERTKLVNNTKDTKVFAFVVPGIAEEDGLKAIGDCEHYITRFCC